MSTTTDETITNEIPEYEEPKEIRDINVLLALDTYQGMTDSEIELVLNYRIDQAVTSRETLANIAAITAKQEQCIADNQASAQAVLDMVQSLVSREFPTVPLMKPKRFEPTTIA